jgi:predicted O-methyltransferase YrrM
MPTPQPSPDGALTGHELARERAMGEVSDVLLCIEHALDRARRAHKNVTKSGVDSNAELALAEAAASLDRLRKRLFQDTYFSADKLRLM